MIRLSQLQQYKKNNEKFSCLTCYDATFAKAFEIAQIDTILVGDSLGMVIQGHDSTLPVSVADIAYHTKAVARQNSYAWIMADMPFMSYSTLPDAIHNATQLMQAGAHAVKLEGGAWLAETVRVLAQGGIPSCIHLGLTPQSVNVLGGYKLQGKTRSSADQLLDDCRAVVEAGAVMLLLECVPAQLAKEVQATFHVPVIGIGAGVDCDGQVLVLHDMLGLNFHKPARFVRDFMTEQLTNPNPRHANPIVSALACFHEAVKDQSYPALQHTFQVELK